MGAITTQKKPRERLIRLLGAVLAIAAAGFILYSLSIYTSDPEFRAVLRTSPAALCAGVLAFFICNVVSGIAWVLLLAALGAHGSRSRLVGIFLLAGAAKYLPGNVGHFVGRAALASREGVPVARSSVSFLMEAALVAFVGACIAVYHFETLPIIPFELPDHPLEHFLFFSLLVGIISLAAVEWLRWKGIALPSRLRMAASISGAAVIFVGCFLLLGWVTQYTIAADSIDLLAGTSVFALSFVVGFLVPGAPGGVGVREAVFIASLAPELRAAGTAAILILRISQLIADGLACAAGWFVLRSPAAAAAELQRVEP